MSDWISVNERLPEGRGITRVLVYIDYKFDMTGRGYYTYLGEWDEYSRSWSWGDGWSRHSEDEYYSVTHWMPLPESPKSAKMALDDE